MNLLLDTHVFLWWDSEPERLSPQLLALCEDEDNTLVLSIASVWEMQIKVQIGKLQLRVPLADLIADQQSLNNIVLLPVQLQHVLALQSLPLHHKDTDRGARAQKCLHLAKWALVIPILLPYN